MIYFLFWRPQFLLLSHFSPGKEIFKSNMKEYLSSAIKNSYKGPQLKLTSYLQWCWVGGGGGGLQDFSVSPSPLGTNQVLEVIGTWLGLGQGDFGTVGGQGLTIRQQPVI